jgi:hypothetical protein
MLRKLALMLAVGLVTAAVVPASADAVTADAVSSPCVQRVGFQDVEGGLNAWDVTATAVPAVKQVRFGGAGLSYARASASWYYRLYPQQGLSEWRAMMLSGTGIYQPTLTYHPGSSNPDIIDRRINGGWGAFTQLATSDVAARKGRDMLMYGLRNDGTLFRYEGIMPYGSAPGFGSVKAMTVISENASYDTLLATTRGGALYTIRIPVRLPLAPIVRRVRDAGWERFESLVVDSCGQNGTLLTAVDQDTDTAYLYAVGHANGSATVIRSLGKIGATFEARTYFEMTREYKNLSGE